MKRQSAPFKVLYSNDTTNIETCTSPYHSKGEPFTEAMLRATVDEVAGTGVDAHFLQPGMGSVAWWHSKAYPYAEHVRFMRETYGMEPSDSGYAQYMAQGGDMVAAFLDQCRKRGMAAFISLRMNDSHGHEFLSLRDRNEIPAWTWHVFSRWMAEHPHLRLSEDLTDWNKRIFNYMHHAVREQRLAFVREIIEQYDIDGFELDFMRHFRLFDFVNTSFEQRAFVLAEIVAQVRDMLDRKGGRYRFLCVRIPAWKELGDQLGVDVPRLIDAGVDMFNVSASYFTEQDNELEYVTRQAAGRAKVYYEMCHSVYNGRSAQRKHAYDNFTFMRATDEMFYATAKLAYEKGADGVSFFNFVYYREHGTPGRGPFHEPPFHVFRNIGDRKAMAEQPGHYFLAPGFQTSYMIDTRKQMPRNIQADTRIQLTLTVGQPRLPHARLRIHAEQDLSGVEVAAHINGHLAAPTDDVSAFYPQPYESLAPQPWQCKAFEYDTALLQPGKNRIALTFENVTADLKLIMVETWC